ncbi:MAG: hypothetical protein GWP06_12945 [Actinobacteria bacterium]|nr:hypothetical protein [Actinomycetota bacterium]
MTKTVWWKIFSFIIVLLTFATLAAQAEKPTATPDSAVVQAKANTDTTAAAKKSVYKEYILQTIRIEAVIEKPTVTLIPKRTETDVGQVPFRARSFDKELKTKPKALSNYGEELENAKRIQKIKKLLVKESK